MENLKAKEIGEVGQAKAGHFKERPRLAARRRGRSHHAVAAAGDLIDVHAADAAEAHLAAAVGRVGGQWQLSSPLVGRTSVAAAATTDHLQAAGNRPRSCRRRKERRGGLRRGGSE